MAGEATRILLQDVEKRERKRQQNRIAQRNYRRNQKQRIQALEAALGQLEPLDPACTLASPATSSTDTFELPSTSPPTASTMTLQPSNPTTSPCDDHALWSLDNAWKPQPQPQLQQQPQAQQHPQPITPLTPTPTTTDMLPTTTPPPPSSQPQTLTTSTTTGTTSPTGPPPIAGETPRSPLHLALLHNHTPIIRLLLDRGADPSKPDPHPSSQGSAPLHIAAERGSESLTALLLEKGADVEGRDGRGRTALMRAVMGPSLSISNDEGRCPCGGYRGNNDDTDGSREENREGVVRLLLEASADVNARDARGKMALHWAVESGLEGLVVLLLQYGADVDA
ncbi:ankyrin repeat-containing domain protein [Chaetomium sp. MPI-SDFR-AT-0129]|nr:ankyrin repeat-containing domain protein [Chaetomium sp. MPI-SDFR-AT-0129]